MRSRYLKGYFLNRICATYGGCYEGFMHTRIRLPVVVTGEWAELQIAYLETTAVVRIAGAPIKFLAGYHRAGQLPIGFVAQRSSSCSARFQRDG